MEGLSPAAMAQVAAYFQALAEPTRLQVLNLLRTGERNVGEIAAELGYTSANISRHLSLLTQRGLARRESRGTAVYYSIADPGVFALCDLVCGSIARHHETAAREGQVFMASAKRATRGGRRALK